MDPYLYLHFNKYLSFGIHIYIYIKKYHVVYIDICGTSSNPNLLQSMSALGRVSKPRSVDPRDNHIHPAHVGIIKSRPPGDKATHPTTMMKLFLQKKKVYQNTWCFNSIARKPVYSQTSGSYLECLNSTRTKNRGTNH